MNPLPKTKTATLNAWLKVRLAMDNNRKEYGGSAAQKATAEALRFQLETTHGMSYADLSTILREESNSRDNSY